MQLPFRHNIAAQRFAPPPAKFYRMPMVIEITGLGRSTIYRLIAENKFPEPVRVGNRAVAWRQSDLEKWSAGREQSTH